MFCRSSSNSMCSSPNTNCRGIVQSLLEQAFVLHPSIVCSKLNHACLRLIPHVQYCTHSTAVSVIQVDKTVAHYSVL